VIGVEIISVVLWIWPRRRCKRRISLSVGDRLGFVGLGGFYGNLSLIARSA